MAASMELLLEGLKMLKFDKAGVQTITPDPAMTTLGANGAAIAFHRDPVFTAESINRLSPDDAGRWREFLDATQRLATIFRELNRHPAPRQEEPEPTHALHADGRRRRHVGVVRQ